MSNGIQHGELVLFDCPRVRKSEYWQFIKLVAPHGQHQPPHGQTHWLSQDANDAYCLKCSKMFRFVKGSSNSVRRHMERFHRKELSKYYAQMHKTSCETTTRNGAASGTTTNNSATSKASQPHKRGAMDLETTETSQNSPTKKRLQSPSGMESATCNKLNVVELLVRWLSTSMRLLAVVEDEGLVQMIESLANTCTGSSLSFLMPSQDSMRHHLQVTAETMRFELKNRIRQEATSLCLSAQLWSHAALSSDFLALSCSYLTNQFVFKSFTLEVWDLDKPLSNSSKEEFYEQVQQVMRDFGLSRIAKSLFVYDERLEPLTSAFEGSEMRLLSDYFHSVQWIVTPFLGLQVEATSLAPQVTHETELLASFEALSKGIQVLREAMSCCAVSREFQEKIAVLQRVHGEVGKRFMDFCLPNEWLALYDSLKRALQYQFVFDSLPLPTLNPTVETWYVVEAVLVLLGPLVEVMGVVNSGSTCTFPLVLPCLRIAMRELSRHGLFDELTVRYRTNLDYASTLLQSHLEAVRQYVLKEVTHRYGALCDQLLWCSALDPRCARLRHLEKEDERESCKQEIIHQALTWHFNQNQTESALTASATPTAASASTVSADDAISALEPNFDRDMLFNGVGSTRTPAQSGLMHRLLYDEDDETVPSDSLTRESDMDHTLALISNEVSTYFTEHQVRKTRIACPFQWWATNGDRFPHLSSLTRCWLGSISGSTSSAARKQLFSLEIAEEMLQEPLEVRKSMRHRIFLHRNLS